MRIAFAGNPNSGKTTMYNALTGRNERVGNWAGVTVERKESPIKKGYYDGTEELVAVDLPGAYSMSPFTSEESITSGYVKNENPDVIINIVDATNLSRSLFFTTQLLELGIPVVIAVNMIDIVRKNGDKIDLAKLGAELGCAVMETSALKGEGSMAVAEKAIAIASGRAANEQPHVFTGSVEHAIAHIEESISDKVDAQNLRWYAIKLFERDEKVAAELDLGSRLMTHLETHIKDCEKELDDDAESIITNQRYAYISKVVDRCVKKKAARHSMTASDKIDRIVTNRVLALPIFAVVMYLVYWIAMGPFGSFLTDWTNDVFAAEWLQGGAAALLEGWGVAGWLTGLIVDGIIGGVGAVLGFVPQMLVLFLMLSVLEDIGYMARIAFILDRVFRKFGLSGKSFIPMLIGSGCGVPGVMASRTIENDRDRKMTIMTTCFIPCGAKMPIIGLFAGALFGGSGLVAVSAYFIGVAAIVISGIMLKKTKPFAGEPAPFVMELPAYHVPSAKNVLHATWERGWSFIKRAGTIILASSVVLWFLQGFGFTDGSFGMVEDNNSSLLAVVGSAVSFIFAPLGFGDWQSTVATVTGLIAKENVVSTFGVLFHVGEEVAEDDANLWSAVALHYTQLSAYSFMLFNLLCAPCFAAMGAIKREMNNGKWTLAAIGYMCVFAYAVSLITYQLGGLITGETAFGAGTVAALLVLAFLIYMLVRPNQYNADYKRGGAASGKLNGKINV